MEIASFSGKYVVKRIGDQDVGEVFRLCSQNPLYYEFCPPFVTEESIRRDMRALPPKKGMGDKYYIGYYEGGRLIAVMDFIDACPRPGAAFVGFFMTAAAMQHKGVGTEIIGELCGYLQRLRYGEVRLGWVKGNYQSESFWRKNGFAETGDAYDTDGYTVVLARRILGSG